MERGADPAGICQSPMRSRSLRAHSEAYVTLLRHHIANSPSDVASTGIDFSVDKSPARLTDSGFTSSDGAYHPCPHRILADTCAGKGLVGEDLVAWVRRVDPRLVTVKSADPSASPIAGVAPGVTTVATARVDIRGLTFKDVTGALVEVPELCNVPVVPHFRGILLPVVFHDALQLDISYSTKLATFVVPPADAHLDSVVVSTPFSCEQEDTMSLQTGVALPVLYAEDTTHIPARDQPVIDCRAPYGIPDGAKVWLTPLDSTRESDIGALVAHCSGGSDA